MNYAVVPVHDSKEHEEYSSMCECEPKIEHVDGNMIFIHNAFDGRLAVEWAEDILREKNA
ncbi:MAG: hypothetical protein EPO24_09425 [Bacteroidetes bacterium]|nr:MAG: hypothetical protein EPO24_09425 [Bacteroidota bacterium]